MTSRWRMQERSEKLPLSVRLSRNEGQWTTIVCLFCLGTSFLNPFSEDEEITAGYVLEITSEVLEKPFKVHL